MVFGLRGPASQQEMAALFFFCFFEAPSREAPSCIREKKKTTSDRSRGTFFTVTVSDERSSRQGLKNTALFFIVTPKAVMAR